MKNVQNALERIQLQQRQNPRTWWDRTSHCPVTPGQQYPNYSSVPTSWDIIPGQQYPNHSSVPVSWDIIPGQEYPNYSSVPTSWDIIPGQQHPNYSSAPRSWDISRDGIFAAINGHKFNYAQLCEFQQKLKMDLLTETKPGLPHTKIQIPEIQHNQTPLCPVIPVTETSAKPDESRKRKKIQCPHCSEIFDSHSIERHSDNCLVYAKLIKNGLQCRVCSKSFKRRRDLNQHIGHHHKDVLKEFVPFLNGVLFKNANPRVVQTPSFLSNPKNENQIPF